MSRMKGRTLLTRIVWEKENSSGISARIIMAIQHSASKRPLRFLRKILFFNSGSRIIRRIERDRLIVSMVIKDILKGVYPFSVLLYSCIKVSRSRKSAAFSSELLACTRALSIALISALQNSLRSSLFV